MRLAAVSATPISARDLAELVSASDAGAVVTFSGDVRDHSDGRPVVRLDYEGHPSAARAIVTIAADIAARHDVVALAVAHRVGELSVGDCAFAVAVSAGHRAEAFAACSDLVDSTKALLPVWKHQVFADGTDEWVNSA